MRKKNTPLDSIIESYLLYCHDLADPTREFYEKNLGHFAKWLRASEYETVLGDIDPNVVNQYVVDRRKVSPYVARGACASLKGVRIVARSSRHTSRTRTERPR